MWVYSPGCHSHSLGLRYRCPSTTHAYAWVVWVFFAHIDFESPQCFPKWWITFRLPCPSLSMLSHISLAFSSQQLQNHAFFHISSSATTNHLASQQLLGLCETSRQVLCWVG